MRRVKLFVATSLDGFLADKKGSVEWLFTDQDYGLSGFLASVDTVLLGRRTFQFLLEHGERCYAGKRNIVFSRTLAAGDFPEVEVVRRSGRELVATLRQEDGKDVWLVGGANLFHHLAAAGQIDDIILAVHPLLLGGGVALFCPDGPRHGLSLASCRPFDTGLVLQHYSVTGQ